MGYQSFRDLRVWLGAKELAVHVYKLTEEKPISRNFGLRDQMRRAAVSVASNIAEGYERNSNKEFVRFLFISKGSLSELRTQIEIAYEISHIEETAYNNINQLCQSIGSMLTKLIQARQR